MQFSICVDALYSGWDFADSIPAVKAAGFEAIEFWSWCKDRDIARNKMRGTPADIGCMR